MFLSLSLYKSKNKTKHILRRGVNTKQKALGGWARAEPGMGSVTAKTEQRNEPSSEEGEWPGSGEGSGDR